MNDSHFDAVIVGSGFGGSVMAYRLAQAGFRVCVLERGKAYPPNSFPRAPHRMKKNFWDPSEGLYGMFNVWSFEELGAVVCSGLGGGSLIYANVLIRKDERWFVKEDLHGGGYEYWPVTRADLDPHYDRVERMLGAQRYPFDKEPYNETPKTKEYKAAAERLGADWRLPNLAVTFANEGEDPMPGEPIREAYPNLHGRTRQTCRLVGECDIGCNYGSKNTLDYNYLSEAKRLGAEIHTLCEVRRFQPRDGGGYAVYYVRHRPDPEREGHKTDTSALPEHTITADRLVLSAGTLGSSFLLLKNRGAFPGLSGRLGTQFSGNGDLITFALKSSKIVGGKRVPRLIDGGYGPVITSAVRFPDREDGGDGRGFYVEDAGYPEFVNWILEVVDAPTDAVRSFWGNLFERIRDKWLSREPETDVGAEALRLLGSTELSSGLLPLLGMGRDIPNGKMELRGGLLNVNWQVEESKAYFDDIREKMRDIAEELGARYLDPLDRLNHLVTAHPLGGCPMGRDKTEGVVDSYGEVFDYPDFYITDGSVMPGPVGTNPSLTIAALANRFADRIIENKGAGR
jgi:cholesterol oxidase